MKKYQLTNTEKEILHLLIDEFLTLKQIAQRRQTSLQAVYKVRKKLIQKGAFSRGLKKVENIETTFNQSDIRLHGQEFNIKILFQDNKYQKLLTKSNVLFLDSNTIRLYKNSVEVYSGQSFHGKSTGETEQKSLDYWNRFFARLEHDLKVCLIKNRARNIRVVNQHWARGDSEICDNARENDKRIWIYAAEDGKLCFITDDSFGWREDETLHPVTAKPDREAIDKQVNDWRLNNPPTQSEMYQIQAEQGKNMGILVTSINTLTELQKGVPMVLNKFEKNIESHLALIKEWRKENISWRKHKVKEIKSELIHGKQTKLGEFF